MDHNRKPFRDIRQRTFEYASRVIKLYQALEAGSQGAGRVLSGQLLRSATSIGANIEEAQSAESRRDFIHKLTIAQKEARESLYWLRLIEKSKIIPPKRLGLLMQETDEITAVITAIILSTKKNLKGSRS